MLQTVSLENSVSITRRSIGSLAFIKLGIDEGKDYVDNFIPFIATIIHKNNYDRITAAIVCRDFEQEFGLRIPRLAMSTILNRARRRGLIRRTINHEWIPTEHIGDVQFYDETNEQNQKLSNLIGTFTIYAKEVFNVTLSREEAEEAIVIFLKNHCMDFFSNGRTVSLPEVQTSCQKKYVFNRFVKHIYDEDITTYKFVVGLAVGYVYANTLIYRNFESSHRMERLNCYFDTRLVFQILGFEDDERRESIKELLDTLKELGAKLYVYRHTLDEMQSILRHAEVWVERTDYNPGKSGLALRYFISKGLKKGDIRLINATLEAKLNNLGIEIHESVDLQQYEKYVIDEQGLTDCINDIYRIYYSDSDSNNTAISKDVKSISFTYALRQGKRSNRIERIEQLFVTTNTSIALADRKMNNGDNVVIPACISHVVLGTLLWLKSPTQVISFNEKKVIADCVAALHPNDLLINKFCATVEQLEKDGTITQEQAIMARTQDMVWTLLGDKTFGDPEEYTERTAEEIVQEMMDRMKAEARKDLTDEKTKHDDTKQALINTKDDLEKAKTQIDNINAKFERWAKNGANIVALSMYIILLAIAIYGYVWPVLSVYGTPVKVIPAIIAACLAVAGQATGLLNKIKDKARDIIYRRLSEAFK